MTLRFHATMHRLIPLLDACGLDVTNPWRLTVGSWTYGVSGNALGEIFIRVNRHDDVRLAWVDHATDTLFVAPSALALLLNVNGPQAVLARFGIRGSMRDALPADEVLQRTLASA